MNNKWHVLYLPRGYRPETLESIKEVFQPFGEIYTPSYTVYKRKKFTVKPIFPGYVFFKGPTENSLLDALKEKNVYATYLKDSAEQEYVKITEDEIINLRNLEINYLAKHKKSSEDFKIGDVVTIGVGPLAESSGSIKQITDDFIYVELIMLSKPYTVPFKHCEICGCGEPDEDEEID